MRGHGQQISWFYIMGIQSFCETELRPQGHSDESQNFGKQWIIGGWQQGTEAILKTGTRFDFIEAMPYWWPGDPRSQCISSHSIKLVLWDYSGLEYMTWVVLHQPFTWLQYKTIGLEAHDLGWLQLQASEWVSKKKKFFKRAHFFSKNG